MLSGIKWIGGAGADAKGRFDGPGDVDSFSLPLETKMNVQCHFWKCVSSWLTHWAGQGVMSLVDQKEHHGRWFELGGGSLNFILSALVIFHFGSFCLSPSLHSELRAMWALSIGVPSLFS